MTFTLSSCCGYSAGHPWYYVLGGPVPKLKQIRAHALARGYYGYLADDIETANRKQEPDRSLALATLRTRVLAELKADIGKYRRAARNLHIVRRRKSGKPEEPSCDGVHVAISLKFNHLINGFVHLHTLDQLPKQLDMFGG